MSLLLALARRRPRRREGAQLVGLEGDGDAGWTPVDEGEAEETAPDPYLPVSPPRQRPSGRIERRAAR